MKLNVSHSEEAIAKIKDIEIVYDTFGDQGSPPMLLVMGLGAQLISWDEEFCERLAARGYWVIRYDNRDIGLSTKFDDAGVPDLLKMFQASMQGEAIQAPYSLGDMAGDAVCLLAVLEIEAAHVVGVSMGGMIAQMMAINHPERVLTMTSLMSSTWDPELPPPTPEALMVLTTPAPSDFEEYIEQNIKAWKILGGPKLPFDEARARERAERAFKRGLSPDGFARQLAAVLSSGSRRERLKSVNIPSLIIHGDADPLIPVEAGIDTANSIPRAVLMIIEGMGHDLPPVVWPQMVEALTSHAVQN
ncbi:MAG: alpha/beta hydrolase [Anaerolineales bacterium]